MIVDEFYFIWFAELPYVQLEVNVLNSTSVNVSRLLDSRVPEQFSDYSTNILVRFEIHSVFMVSQYLTMCILFCYWRWCLGKSTPSQRMGGISKGM